MVAVATNMPRELEISTGRHPKIRPTIFTKLMYCVTPKPQQQLGQEQHPCASAAHLFGPLIELLHQLAKLRGQGSFGPEKA